MIEEILEQYDPELIFTIIGLFIGILYGVIAQRKQFCFSGSIKDIIIFNHKKRLASLLVAIITAIVSTQILAYYFEIELIDTRYFSNINFIFIIIGGLMFGYGMMVSDGCSSRHLVKFAQGDINSLYIIIALGAFSYLTYSNIATINSTDIVQSIITQEVSSIPFYIPIVIALFILIKSVDRLKDILQCWDGFLIGLIIPFVWYITAVLASDYFVNITAQSLSFVHPTGKFVQVINEGFNIQILSFASYVVIGVLIGAFISSLFNKEYSKKVMCDTSNQNPPSLKSKIVGGAFMGVGGILATGCTVGQGLSGISTLAISSFVAAISIYTSGYITAKYLHKKNALIACFIFDFKK